MENKEEWIRAADAVRLLKPVFDSEYEAKMTICQRAHAGLIRARAERFMVDDRSADDHKVPKEFWWAEGHVALEQNWTTGDFSTWIRRTTRLRAFNISFLREDIEKLRGTASPTPTAVGPSVTASQVSAEARDGEARRDVMGWDVFISHASEDKDDFVRLLADNLQRSGLRVWFDEFTLTVGDSLRRSIDRGLAKSQYGIVVISPSFLEKDWPQRELDGLVAREIDGVKVILPVWHNIGADEIRRYSPMLADRLAAVSSRGIDHVTSQLIQAIHKNNVVPFQIVTGPPTAAASNLEELSRYASEFHRRRTDLIAAGKGSIAVLDGGRLVLHVVPHSALTEQTVISFEAITREPRYFPPVGDTYGRDFKITYDGLLVGSNAEGLIKPQRAYVHVFRWGAIEAVVSSLARGYEHKFIVLPEVQALLIKFTNLYAKSLHHFGIETPMSINVSLINVEGMKLLQDFIGTALPEDLPRGDLDRPLFRFGQVTFGTIPRDYNETAKYLGTILAHLANTAGLHASPYFDANGNYVGNLR